MVTCSELCFKLSLAAVGRRNLWGKGREQWGVGAVPRQEMDMAQMGAGCTSGEEHVVSGQTLAGAANRICWPVLAAENTQGTKYGIWGW